MEEREALEALQLEKRLSLLSHGGSAGDERSLSSSSSEASHSDVSAGSRLGGWQERPPSAAASQEGGAQAAGEGAVPGPRAPPRPPLAPRQLQEAGRQSSSDSGIATGSPYSGSCSSCAGSSLDVWRGGPEEVRPRLCTCPPAHYQVPGPRQHYDTPRSVLRGPTTCLPEDQPGPSRPWDMGETSTPFSACPVCGGLRVSPPP